MAHYEMNAIVRISTIQTSIVGLSGATRLDMTPLDYPNNNSLQEESGRISCTQMMTTRRVGGFDGYFSHVIANSVIDATSKDNHLLPLSYRSGGERPIGAANGVEFGEMSCSLPSHNPTGASVGIQTLVSSNYSDNAVDNTSLVEFM
jgi:hypothetical protein